MSDTAASRGLFPQFPQALFLLALIVAVALNWWLKWPLPEFPHRFWTGVTVIGIALAWVGWAILEMRALKTSPFPWKESTALVRYGPYRFGRNPIYLGDIVALVGLSLVLGNTWMLIAALVCVPLTRVLVIHHEEAYLADHFGAEWQAYAEKVRRWI